MSKYPFATLAAGQSATIPFSSSPNAARVALHNFRQHCLVLGWPADALPNYRLTFGPGTLTIDRLPDGHQLPTGPRLPDPAADPLAGMAPELTERAKAMRRIDALEYAFGARQEAAAEAGQADWQDMKIPRELQDLYLRWMPGNAYPEDRVEPAEEAAK